MQPNQQKGWNWLIVMTVAMWLCILLGVLFLLFGCLGMLISDAEVLSAVERAGYTKPVIVSKHEFMPGYSGCGSDDVAAYDIEAINAQNKTVRFIACAGWPFKNVTIRF